MRYLILPGLLTLMFLVSCKEEPDGPAIKVENEVNDFVRDGLNSWYFYQGEVAELRDNYFDSRSERNEFLNMFEDPTTLFNELLHPEDEFSYIVEDYEQLEQSRQGISNSFGYEFGLLLLSDENSVIGYVQYVLPDSPAEREGLRRGDIFYQVDNTPITRDNYQDLLFGSPSYTLSLADLNNGSLEATGRSISLTAEQITENPVFLSSVLELENGTRIGYLVYNAFTYTFHEALNNAIGQIQSQGIDEMVLDLRYNGGGSVYTSMHLAGMLYDDATENDIFARILHNEKKSGMDQNLPFLTQVDILDNDFNVLRSVSMNRLNLSRIFILTGRGTASASELIINGLEPYMEVILIGTETVGKNEGSRTLYDSPESDYTEKSSANPSHKYAMQPIINRLSNVDNFTEYSNGFSPDIAVNETNYLDSLPPLGSLTEPVLSAAIEAITGTASRHSIRPSDLNVELIDQSAKHRKFSETMYMDGTSNPLQTRQ